MSVLDDASIGQIEEWVISTLEDRSRPVREAEWLETLDGLSLTKKTPKARERSGSPVAEPVGWARFRLSRRRGVAIVSLTDQALVKEEDLIELTGDLEALVEAGHRRIVLDFFAVERLSSWAARLIDEVSRRCAEPEGAAIKFSGLRPDVARIFAMTGLDPRVSLYPDTASAVSSVWPDLPVLRPLPVSILTALLRAEENRYESKTRVSPKGGLDEDPATVTTLARLIVQDGRSSGRSISIKGGRFLIGRGPTCDLLVRSATVSRSHARIERQGSKLILTDLESTNGTTLNGRILRNVSAELRDGDTIRVGRLSFRLSLGRATETVLVPEENAPEYFPGSALYPLLNSLAEPSGPTEEFQDLGTLLQAEGLKLEVIEGVLIVTPLTPDLDDEADVDALREALISLGARGVPNRVVINLTNVGHLSGRAIGVLVAHHLRLDRSGGALRVCLANPRVAVVLEQIKLGMLVNYHPTVEEAVIAAWPESVLPG